MKIWKVWTCSAPAHSSSAESKTVSLQVPLSEINTYWSVLADGFGQNFRSRMTAFIKLIINFSFNNDRFSGNILFSENISIQDKIIKILPTSSYT